MPAKEVKNIIVWGILLWITGYLLGIVLFFIVPKSLIGWIILPIGTLMTLYVLSRIREASFNSSLIIACTWTLMAISFDYFFLVKLFNPPDGYYKVDVYVYYIATFALPLLMSLKFKIENGK